MTYYMHVGLKLLTLVHITVSVGLPARGKSYIVKKLRRYLNWLQYETKVRRIVILFCLAHSIFVTHVNITRCSMSVTFDERVSHPTSTISLQNSLIRITRI